MTAALQPDYSSAIEKLERNIQDPTFEESAKIGFLRSWTHLKSLPWATDATLRQCLKDKQISGWKWGENGKL